MQVVGEAVQGAAESVSQFMSERVQRIKELADKEGVLESKDEELERIIQRYHHQVTLRTFDTTYTSWNIIYIYIYI